MLYLSQNKQNIISVIIISNYTGMGEVRGEKVYNIVTFRLLKIHEENIVDRVT